MAKSSNNGSRYANVITTIGCLAFLVFRTHIGGRLNDLDSRLRAVEKQIAVISSKLGIKTGTTTIHSRAAEAPAAAGLDLFAPAGSSLHTTP